MLRNVNSRMSVACVRQSMHVCIPRIPDSRWSVQSTGKRNLHKKLTKQHHSFSTLVTHMRIVLSSFYTAWVRISQTPTHVHVDFIATPYMYMYMVLYRLGMFTRYDTNAYMYATPNTLVRAVKLTLIPVVHTYMYMYSHSCDSQQWKESKRCIHVCTCQQHVHLLSAFNKSLCICFNYIQFKGKQWLSEKLKWLMHNPTPRPVPKTPLKQEHSPWNVECGLKIHNSHLEVVQTTNQIIME